MKKIIFIFFIAFTFYSCAYEGASFEPISKKELMESWAWKIFIFTDEGETMSIETAQNNFDGNIDEKTIFANDLFFTNHKVVIEEDVASTIFEKIKRRK